MRSRRRTGTAIGIRRSRCRVSQAAAVADDPHSRRLRHVIGLGQQTPTEAQILAARRAYFGAGIVRRRSDWHAARALRDARLDGNTIVIVLADHGDMLGERGLWYKMNFFEPACRIPLIVCAPGYYAPRRVDAHASLLDVLPTLVELGSDGRALEYAAPLDGRSLVARLGRAPRRSAGSRPHEVIGEYLAEGAIAPVVMIRRGQS